MVRVLQVSFSSHEATTYLPTLGNQKRRCLSAQLGHNPNLHRTQPAPTKKLREPTAAYIYIYIYMYIYLFINLYLCTYTCAQTSR